MLLYAAKTIINFLRILCGQDFFFSRWIIARTEQLDQKDGQKKSLCLSPSPLLCPNHRQTWLLVVRQLCWWTGCKKLDWRVEDIDYNVKVVSCRVRTNHSRGICPGYSPAKNFCKFSRTFIPVPGTSGNSVRQPYPYPELLRVPYAGQCHKYLGCGYTIFITHLSSSVDAWHNTQNFFEFCNTSVPYQLLLQV